MSSKIRVKVLLSRQVIAFPDLGACERRRKKAKDYPLLEITVSDCLEKNATPQQREMGTDLADRVVEERMAEGVEALLEDLARALPKTTSEI